jgi:hypothetical protein
MKTLGIDPGKTGAIAIYDTIAKDFTFVDWPDSSKEMADVLFNESGRIEFCVIERIISMPLTDKAGNTIRSSRGEGSIRENFGWYIGILEVLDIRFQSLTPAQWRKDLVMRHPNNKRVKEDTKLINLETFSRLFPKEVTKVRGPRGGLKDGRVDAGLMAYKASKIVS